MSLPVLGTCKKKFEYSCQGVLSPKAMWEAVQKIIVLARMTPARKGRLDRYPFNGGGGKGFTIYQPLTESWCIADVYRDLNRSDIELSTCKPERIDEPALIAFLSKEIGPVIPK